jgi:transitional endoplasmic reticulum ATPase
MNKTLIRRNTIVLPVVISCVIYVTINLKVTHGLAGISDMMLLGLSNFMGLLIPLYASSLLWMKFIEDEGAVPFVDAKVVKVIRAVLNIFCPIALAIFSGLMSTMTGDNPWPIARAIQLPLFVTATHVVTLVLLVLGVFVGAMLMFPVQWLLGIKEVTPTIPPLGEGGAANTSSTERQPTASQPQEEEKVYQFIWTKPTGGLSSMAGMADFKSEVERFIAPYRSYKDNKGPIKDTNGILLSGPAGNGKTVMASMIAAELGLPMVTVTNQDILSKWVNESGSVVKDLFRQAKLQPCVLFFDEIETLAPSRGNSNSHGEDKKVVAALLTEIVNARNSRVVLVAATNFVDQIDAAICRDGRFDLRIDVPYPDFEARVALLTGMLKKFNVKADDKTINHVAQLWERRSVAFIEATVKRLRDAGNVKGATVSVEQFKVASREASRRNSNIPKTGAKLSEIALTESVRRETDSLVYRLKNWEQIAERGGEPPSGVLLYGPPGTGKTNLARALTRELEYWHIFEVNTTDVLHDPRKFRDTVELAAQHRPAIIFMDEADELLRDRTHSHAAGATNEILKAMDGLMGKVPEVLFMAATNNAEVIDGAALRGGRFSEKIFMGPLEGNDLVVFLEKEFKNKAKVEFAADLTPHSLADRLQTSAPADAITLLRKAINNTFSEDGSMRAVSMVDIEKAIQATQI